MEELERKMYAEESGEFFDEKRKSLSLFISVKVKKILRKSQAHFRGKLRKLRLRKTDGFPLKKT